MEIDLERLIDRRAGDMCSRTRRWAGGPGPCRLGCHPAFGRVWALWVPSRLWGSPFLSWSPATSHLDLTGEAPAGGQLRVLLLEVGLEGGSGRRWGKETF